MLVGQLESSRRRVRPERWRNVVAGLSFSLACELSVTLTVATVVGSSVGGAIHRRRARKRWGSGYGRPARGGYLPLLRSSRIAVRRIALTVMATMVLSVSGEATLAVGALA